MSKARIIFHIDMNSFYASVEVAYNPQLKGKPVAIAGNPQERKGIIVTSSYEARAKGVKTTMPLWEARRLCPDLIVLPPNFDRYRKASTAIFKRLAKFTPLIEPVSIDEGYMDVTDYDQEALNLATHIQKTLVKELKLPSSIGIGPNKFLAKTASDMKKPLGITVLRIRDIKARLWPLPVDEMFGIGKKTAEKLNEVGIYTIGELAKADTYDLTQLLGINGERIKNKANGFDPRPVDPDAVNEFKSIGNSRTLSHDSVDTNELYTLLRMLSKRVEQRLKRRELMGQTVQLMIRYYDRQTVTRGIKLPHYIAEKRDIYQTVIQLFQTHWNKQPIRLLGVTVQDIIHQKDFVKQLDIFTYEKEIKQKKLEQTVQSLTSKYGEETFKQYEKEDQDDLLRTSFQKDFLDDFNN